MVTRPTGTIVRELERIVGGQVYPYSALATDLQARIVLAVAPDSQVECVVYPRTPEELAEIMVCAHRNRWRVLPTGRASKLGWGGLARGVDLVVSTERLDRLVEHAVGDLTVTVEAGLRFAQLEKSLAAAGQFLGIDPAYPESASLGGVLATADTGSLRQRHGGVRDLCLGLSLVRADGKIAKAGGRVVKNVAGYDLMKLLTGSHGTLGIVTQMTLRLYPLAEASRTVLLSGTAEAIAGVCLTLRTSALTPGGLDVLSTSTVARLGIAPGLGLAVRFMGLTASVDKQCGLCLEVGRAWGAEGTSLEDTRYRLHEHLRSAVPGPNVLLCKAGVLPARSVELLSTLDTICAEHGIASSGIVYAGSGLAVLRFGPEGAECAKTVARVRAYCESQGGFLSVLEASPAFKQQFDVWGYTGNALGMMRRVKQQFDPESILSPGRFVGGI